MAKGNKDDSLRLTNPTLPRIVASITGSLEFSSSAPGRPEVPWMVGINPEMVRELWPSDGDLPYAEYELPPLISSMIPELPTKWKSWDLGIVKKMVVYERIHPEIRLVLLLDPPYGFAGETWQPIVQSRVERDRGVDPRHSRVREERLWAEVCRVERRGRPRGTGHPKKPVQQPFPTFPNLLSRLRKIGLDDKDIKVLFGRWGNKTFKQIGQELGISAPAVWSRWQRRIEPRLKQASPKFSAKSFWFVRDSK